MLPACRKGERNIETSLGHGEEIVVPANLSGGRPQEYVEDCPVYCAPNVVRVRVDRTGQVHIDSHAES